MNQQPAPSSIPQGIDMGLIREALARRMGGGLGGGGGTPQAGQVASPMGVGPQGGTASPLQPAQPVAPTGPLGPAGAGGQPDPSQLAAAQGGAGGPGTQPGGGPGAFDEPTKMTARALIARLMKVL